MKGFDFKVGFSCNNDCIHCVVGSKRALSGDLKTDEIKKIIDEKVKNNYDSIGFTGGEVSIRKDAIELFKYAKEAGLFVAIQTNGTGFYDEEFTKEASKYIDQALVAIHSINRNIHNEIVQDKTNSMFDKTMGGLQNLINCGVYCRTQTVISGLNINSLYDTYKYIQNKYPGILMNLTYPHAMGRAYDNWPIVCLKYSDIKAEIHKILKDFGKYISTEAIPYCYLYPYEETLAGNSDERVFDFLSLNSGIDPSYRKMDGGELFDKEGITENYSINDLTSKIKASKCKECIFFDKCPGVWKEYYEFYKDSLDLFPIKADSFLKKNDCRVNNFLEKDDCSIIMYNGKSNCENICLFCGGGAPIHGEEENFEYLKKQVDSFKDKHYNVAELSGEACSNKYLIDAIKYIKEAGFNTIQFSTHGRCLKSLELAKRVKNAGVNRIRIPLYGSTKEIHEKTAAPRFGGSSFNDSVEAIKNCANLGIPVCGHTLINNYNKDDIANIIDFYYNITNRNMAEMVIGFTGITELNSNNLKEWYLPFKDSKKYLLKILDDQYYDLINLKIHGYPYCVIGRYDDRIESIFSPPNVMKETIFKGNRSKTDNRFPHYIERTRIKSCDSCLLSAECSGTIKNDNTLFGSEGLEPIIRL